MNPAIIALTRNGALTARMLGFELHGLIGRVEAPDIAFKDTLAHIALLFASGRPIIGVCAAGILIRAVAHLLNDKTNEPPVIAISDDGRQIVPLLGGHRGANKLCREIALMLGIEPSITTAGDTAFGVALDEPPQGWCLSNPQDAKPAMAKMLQQGGAIIDGDLTWLEKLPEVQGVTLKCSVSPLIGDAATLVYHPQKLSLGVGCARNCPPNELADLVMQQLDKANLSPQAIAAIGTIDLKADEPAILELANQLGRPLRLFSASELEELTPRLANPSEVVFKEVGCHGVAEAASLALGGDQASLNQPKTKSAMATCAIAYAPEPIIELKGRKPGSVTLIGIGPGQADWRTPEASKLIHLADELVGYGLYLDLLGPLSACKTCHRYPLGEETERCRFALERAGEGLDIALICSGDAGIYAMAALVFELLDRGHDLSDAAKRVNVISSPGISALQAAASRAGAPLGHDFCTISLSDLMTPWDVIQNRIDAAARGDFVIAFYNPVSMRRRHQLAHAKTVLLEHRPPNTPVLLASNLGRPSEKLLYRTLATLDIEEVDMLTVVLVGSSTSRLFERGQGNAFYTPRGYSEARWNQTKQKDTP